MASPEAEAASTIYRRSQPTIAARQRCSSNVLIRRFPKEYNDNQPFPERCASALRAVAEATPGCNCSMPSLTVIRVLGDGEQQCGRRNPVGFIGGRTTAIRVI